MIMKNVMTGVALISVLASFSAYAGTIPKSLSTMEGTAEDAYDQALAKNFAKVVKDTKTLNILWQKYRPTAVKDGVQKQDIATMDAVLVEVSRVSTSSTDPVAVARAADGISSVMDSFFTIYTPGAPPALMTLDYLGREVALDGMQPDCKGAETHLNAIEKSWTGLRPEVVKAKGSNVAKTYDDSVSTLRAALGTCDTAALIKEAQAGLDIVDQMEKLFP